MTSAGPGLARVVVDGVRLAYRDTGGAGAPVVLLHAFPFCSRMWAPQLDALGERWRLVAPDLKGFGGSDAPDDAGAYTIDSFAAEVLALVEHLGLERVVLAGLSLGGYIALALLRRRPEAVSALVLADTRAEADAAEVAQRRTSQQRQVLAGGTAALAGDMARALLAPATLQSRPDVVARARELMDQPPAGIVGALEAMRGRPDATPGLAAISVPTLVLVGEHDSVTPPDAAARLRDGIAGARLSLVPGAGHISNLEAPDAFTGALAAFLDDL